MADEPSHPSRRRLADAPAHHRGGGQVSRLLTAGSPARALAVTWVEAATGSEQPLHAHADAEQVYVVTRGTGVMTVGADRFTVAAGDLVVVAPGTMHAIRATEPLTFVSATAPPFPVALDGDGWRPV